MSVYKGTQLIATNGTPGKNGTDGRPGTDGRNGQNGQGIMINNSFVELHNNINADGTIEITNESEQSNWSSVGGYGSSISAGQASIVFGYRNSLRSTQNASVFGYENNCINIGQGGFVSGKYNTINELGNGTTVLGHSNTIDLESNGAIVLGSNHNIDNGYTVSDGGIIAGFHVTDDSSLPSMPHMKEDYESTNLILIGLKKGNGSSGDGEVGICVRNDGCVGISGDLAFEALNSNGSSRGRYTLGQIVIALQEAGILT